MFLIPYFAIFGCVSPSVEFIRSSGNHYHNTLECVFKWSQDSPVGVSLDDEKIFQIHDRGRDFAFPQSIQTGSGAHPASFSVGTWGGIFHGDKAAGT